MAILETKNLGIQFGGLKAVDDFNITIEKGALYGLIGPNGAGKTTIFNLLTGVYKPTSGTFFLDGDELKGLSPIAINKKGIARTFQNIRLFDNMSVIDNVKAGFVNSINYSLLESFFHAGRFYSEEKRIEEEAHKILKVFDLDSETAELMKTIKFVRDEFDMTILLIEHDMKLVAGICEELTVLNFGTVLARGKTEEVLNNHDVITAYIGEDD